MGVNIWGACHKLHQTQQALKTQLDEYVQQSKQSQWETQRQLEQLKLYHNGNLTLLDNASERNTWNTERLSIYTTSCELTTNQLKERVRDLSTTNLHQYHMLCVLGVTVIVLLVVTIAAITYLIGSRKEQYRRLKSQDTLLLELSTENTKLESKLDDLRSTLIERRQENENANQQTQSSSLGPSSQTMNMAMNPLDAALLLPRLLQQPAPTAPPAPPQVIYAMPSFAGSTSNSAAPPSST